MIEKISAFYPNEYSSEELLEWLREVDADVKRNIEKSPGVVRALSLDGAVLLPEPYQSMYIFYVLAMIAHYQRDYESYERNMVLYRQKREGYMAYYIRTHGSDSDGFRNWI